MRNIPLVRILTPLAVVVGIAILMIARSFSFAEVPPILAQGIQPAAFPRLICYLVIILAVIALIEDLRRDHDRQDRLPRPFYTSVLALIVVGAIAATGDFLIALMVGTAGISALWGERRWLVLICLGIVAPILTILFFDIAFQVRFPRGILMTYYYG